MKGLEMFGVNCVNRKKGNFMKKILLALPFAVLMFGPAPAKADLRCQPCPYSCEILGISGKHCSYRDSTRPGYCCIDVDGKGTSQAIAAEANLGAGAARYGGGYNNQYGNGSAPDRCPPGFSPSEQKCSQQERARGCKDIRLPSGLGCVNR